MRAATLALAVAALLVPGGGAAMPRAAAACTAPPYRAVPGLRPSYRMQIRIAGSQVTGTSDIRFAAGLPLHRLVLRLWPNGPRQGAALRVTSVAVDGRAARARVSSPTVLVVPLQKPVAPGRTVRIRLAWRLTLGSSALRMNASAGFVRLASFFPILPWDERRGWVVDPPTPLPAEASTSPTADFDVTVHAPAAMRLVASGSEISTGHWVASAVRDFALAGGDFDVTTHTVAAPAPVRLAVAVPRGLGLSAQAFADRAAAGAEGARRPASDRIPGPRSSLP